MTLSWLRKFRKCQILPKFFLSLLNEEYLPLEINVHDIQEIWQVNSKLTFNLDNPSNSGLFQELQQSMNELKRELKSFKS